MDKSLLTRLRAWLPFSSSSPDQFLGEGLAKQVGNVTECALLGFLVELGEGREGDETRGHVGGKGIEGMKRGKGNYNSEFCRYWV